MDTTNRVLSGLQLWLKEDTWVLPWRHPTCKPTLAWKMCRYHLSSLNWKCISSKPLTGDIARLLQEFWALLCQDRQIYLNQTALYNSIRTGDGLTRWQKNLGEVPSWLGIIFRSTTKRLRLVNQLTCAQCRSYKLQIHCVYCLWGPPLFRIALSHWPWSYAKDSGLVLTDREFSILLEKNRVLWQGHRITFCFHLADCCPHCVFKVSCFTSHLCCLFIWPWCQFL